MPLDVVLNMTKMEPGDVLKRYDPPRCRPYNPAIDGEIVFLSHQWVANSHPDPHMQQFKVFQSVIRQLLNGGKVEEKIDEHNLQVLSEMEYGFQSPIFIFFAPKWQKSIQNVWFSVKFRPKFYLKFCFYQNFDFELGSSELCPFHPFRRFHGSRRSMKNFVNEFWEEKIIFLP